MLLTIRENTDLAETWDDHVHASVGWTHFHQYGWKQVIEEVFGHECRYLTAYDENGNIQGVLPLVRIKSLLFGHYLVSMPFLNYGGPLGSQDAIKALIARAIELSNHYKVDLLELRSPGPLEISLPVSHRKITLLLKIPDGGAEALWAQLTTKMRTKIRRAAKTGITVKLGHEGLDNFYSVFSHHMRDLGTPTLPRSFFRKIAVTFGDSVWFAVAYYEDAPIAAGCGFHWGSEFEITWAAGLKSHNRLRANLPLYWELMSHAAGLGIKTFNFGRSTPSGGTHDFKKQWGAEDVPLWWYQHSSGSKAGTPSPDDSAYAWGPRIWKHIPVPITNFLGPKIVRYIP